jgi:hypothetical protein
MTSGAHAREGRFIEVGWGVNDILLGSRVFFLAPGILGTEVDDARTSLIEVAS